ncbi:hypothetical protein R1flu_007969 [Riccia fluitans]|uniref:Uncharacterized protein n=1 Tax=Riccia fluitans TaxID=41844 RepID=A0ABD1YBD0_9MARC
MNSGLRNKVLTQSLIWRSAVQNPKKVSTRSLLAHAGLGTPGSEKGIDSILPCTCWTPGSEKGIDSILPPVRRTRETPGSKKVTHLPLHSVAQNPKKVSTRSLLARAGLGTPGSGTLHVQGGIESPRSEKGINSTLTLRAQDPKQVLARS